jgi:cytochrome c oxidase assembly protein subunit 15
MLVLAVAQVALGGWVSTNYAVLACDEFPTCHGGQWWPALDFAQGFALWRELGTRAGGGWLDLAALAAIHMAHRLGALVVFAALLGLAAWLRCVAGEAGRIWATRLLAVAAWQLISGLSNVILDWPLVAALAHTGGAAVLLTLLTVLNARVRVARFV